MTPQQVRLVQKSWQPVYAQAQYAGELLSERMLELEPATRMLFRGSQEKMGIQLIEMMGMMVDALGNPEAVAMPLRELGHVHRAHHGVSARDFAVVGQALLWTLNRLLGEQSFSPEVREAWKQAYALITGIMLEDDLAQAA